MVFFILLFVMFPSYGTEVEHTHSERSKHIHGSHRECPLPKQQKDIISCAIEFHPLIQQAKYTVESSKSLEGEALQLPNPELDTRYLRGGVEGSDTTELEASLKFKLELGGKRQARVDFAKEEYEFSKLSLNQRKVEVKTKTIISLYRLKQISEEKKLIIKSIGAYEDVILKFKKIPKLTAEQEASLTLFEIALEETKILLSEVFEERKRLEHFFHIATGNSLEELEPFLPMIPQQWPEVAKQKHKDTSARILKLKSLSNSALAKVEVENSKAWPDLNIGPAYTLEKSSERASHEMIGVSLSLPLPLFHFNDGAKALAKSEYLKAKKTVQLMHASESHERFEQLQVYESAVRTLKSSLSIHKIMKKHHRLEKLYSRGVVSNQAYLDSLKQKLDYIQRKNKRVMTAIKSLWNIYKLDGKVMTKDIL